MIFTKPMKAENAELDKLRFPVLAQPKIDGVRGLNVAGQLRTRTLKPFANLKLMEKYSHPLFAGLDGELWHRDRYGEASLCRDTTSVVNTILMTAPIHWTIFDDFSPDVIRLPYEVRLSRVFYRALELQDAGFDFLHAIETRRIENLSELLSFEEEMLAQGYEGVILRDPKGNYKNGRSTVREGGLLRIKRFVDREATVVKLVEAMENLNEKTTNALGLSERSSHQENKIGKQMVGALICETEDGQLITVGPGEMTHGERLLYWERPELIVGKPITYKCFPHGEKLAPRFPTFKTIREELI